MIRSALMNVMTAAATESRPRPETRFRGGGEPPGFRQRSGRLRDRRRQARRERPSSTSSRRRAPAMASLMEEGRQSSKEPTRATAWHHRSPRRHLEFPPWRCRSSPSLSRSEREGPVSSPASSIIRPPTIMFVAEHGQGAYHNNRRMRVAARRTARRVDGRLRHSPRSRVSRRP